jgi:general secretion pathway protein H
MKSRGFTLIEMLVVVVIIGILSSAVVIGFVGSDKEQNLRTEAERLAVLIEMARSQAVQRNEEWGVAVAPDSYRFVVLDEPNHRWVEPKDGAFRKRTIENMTLSVQVDAVAIPGDQTKDNVPNIILFSSGEQTPFDIDVTPQWKSEPWRVSSNGVSRTTAQRRA